MVGATIGTGNILQTNNTVQPGQSGGSRESQAAENDSVAASTAAVTDSVSLSPAALALRAEVTRSAETSEQNEAPPSDTPAATGSGNEPQAGRLDIRV